MKPLAWLVLTLLVLVAPAMEASPSGEEFIIETIPEAQLRSLPTPLPKPVATQTSAPSRLIQVVQGAASWYGPGFYGRTTASGERLRKGTLTAAHRTLPFGTKVRVTNLSNGRSVVVRINDRGPFRYHRVIDLAHGAAQELRMMQAGEVPVQLEILKEKTKRN